MSHRLIVGVLVALFAFWADASAQTAQKFSIQASALGVKLTGIANEELAFGGGGEIQLRWNPSAFSIGLGLQTTRHELNANTITFNGGFLEPRYVFAALGESVGLYTAARLVALDATFTVAGVGELNVDGTAISGGGGLLIRLGSRVNGDLGVTVGKEYYDGEAAEGLTVVTRLGVAIGIG
ncbi:MAG: hypothetical protein OEO79_17440 [Gemmatimonadota bacterium]|nr:hypothetical protein [Gemmatimonadota bacterium]MDH3424158.1 hypothetical protein [Gemmatimonadota bacterium]